MIAKLFLFAQAQTASPVVPTAAQLPAVAAHSIAGDIGVGVISGVVTAALFWLLRTLWVGVLSPMLYDFVYRGVRIDGIWHSSFLETEAGYTEEVEVSQVGHRISGVIRVRSGLDAGRQYLFIGEFQHMILTATYSSESKHTLDRGTFTLKIGQNGNVMRGVSSFYNDETDLIDHGSYEWRRPT